jgi:Tol biopolymer transport system component
VITNLRCVRVAAVVAMAGLLCAAGAVAQVTRASVTSGGVQGASASEWPSISGDGRYVVFESDAANLAPLDIFGTGDTNGVRDIFIHDRVLATTGRVSVVPGVSAGAYIQANGPSSDAQISADGRVIVYTSTATNLIGAADTNGLRDVFALDRQTGVTTRVSVSSAGVQANGDSLEPTISGDGRYVAFVSSATNLVAGDTNLRQDLFVHDRQLATTTRVTGAAGQPDNGTNAPAFSRDGRVLAFTSAATNYVAGDTNATTDVFVFDMTSRAVTRITVSFGGGQTNGPSFAPSLDADGSLVAFHSSATNLVAGDTNNVSDVFRFDRVLGTTRRISLAENQAQATADSGGAALSDDGRFVVFASGSPLVFRDANAVFDVYRFDTANGEVSRVSTSDSGGGGTAASVMATISGDGRIVAFASDAVALVPGDTNARRDVFVHDMAFYRTERLSILGPDQPNGHSTAPSLSDDGLLVAFESAASNLSANDGNGVSDVFVRSRATGALYQISRGIGGADANGISVTPVISGSGRYVAFASDATNLVPGDTNGVADVFVFDRETTQTTRVSVSSSGVQANGACLAPSIDARGRFVTFESSASTLVAGDLGSQRDVFVHDRQTGTTRRVSIGQGRPEADGNSGDPEISGNGRFVVFTSDAANLVDGDTNGVSDVFVAHLETGVVERVSLSSSGLQGARSNLEGAISDDGRYVAFTTFSSGLAAGDTTTTADVVVRDRVGRTTALASIMPGGPQADLESRRPAIAGDGRFVYFQSSATNLVAGDNNSSVDVFRHDRYTGELRRMSLATSGDNQLTSGGNSASTSFDGLTLAFASDSPWVVPDDTARTDVFSRTAVAYVATVYPGADTTAGGGLMTIKGQGFVTGTTVTIDGVLARIVSQSTRVITFVAPPHAAGLLDVLVSVPGTTPIRYEGGLEYFAPGADSDGDGISDADEIAYRMNPICPDDGSSDLDGDGIVSSQELAQQGHPRGGFSRYLAEGATGAFFTTELALLNPTDEPASVLLKFLTTTGQTIVHKRIVPPRTRHTLDVGTLAGLEAAEFSTLLESDVAVVLDRTLTWDGSSYGRHAETAPSAPSRLWYLAEGATHSGFELFYLLQNPNAVDAAAVVSFLRPAPLAPIVRNYTVPARSRFNIWVNLVDPGLAATDVSAEITTSHPVMVERALYRTNGGRTFNAGHESAAVAAPALTWYLAEGATGPYFDLFVLLANPQSVAANVRATFLKPDGSSIVRTYTVAPRSRFNIWVDTVDAALADTAVSTTIEVLNNMPIIVERALWWPGGADTWAEAHNSAGATTTAAAWAIASGEDGGPANAETYVLVANTDNEDVSARVTLFFEDGSTLAREFLIPATSRFNVAIRPEFPAAAGRRFGVVVETIGGSPAPLIVEQAIYNDAGGVHWAAGSNALATVLR